jgi:uncharacterized protein involved in exopolysaccharide biosynthesis
MSVNTLETPGVPDAWVRDDEIDLRQYLDVLIRWWREIVLITAGVAVLAAVAIWIVEQVLPSTYTASADVAIVRTVSDVSFDERFVTTSDEVSGDTSSITARRSALLGLVNTGGIASAVIDKLGDQLEEPERNPAALLATVEAEVGPTAGARADSDLIRITVTADSAEKAATIANAWAEAYVQQVNTVYGQVPDDVLTSIQAELSVAERAYQESQTRLEAFVADNQIKEYTSLLTVLQQRVDQEVALVQSYLANWQQANVQLNSARSLRTQLEQGGDGAARSAMMALQTLKLAAYGTPTEQMQLELRDLPEVTYEAMMADIDGLIVSLEQRVAELDTEIRTRTNGLRPAESSTAAEVASFVPTYTEIRELQARIEAETARKNQLEQQRNLHWEAYKALSNKVAELNLTRAASSSEVRFAAPAVPPVDPEERIDILLGAGLAGFVGLFAALMIAFLSDYLGRQPFLGSQNLQGETLAKSSAA